MWFKNLYFFAFTKPFNWTQEELEKYLTDHKYTPCKSTEQMHFGWTNALGKQGQTLVHGVNQSFILTARREDKIIPPQVIKEMLEEKVSLLETEHSRKATKKEKEQFKEDIVLSLLPRAFSKLSDTQGYVSPKDNLIVVNASSRSKAEDFLALLRKSLGTLPVSSLTPENVAPDEVMTDWLIDKPLSGPFELGTEAEFNAIGDDAAVIKVKIKT